MTATDSTSQSLDLGRVASETFGLVGRNFVTFFVPALLFAGLPAIAILVLQPMLIRPGAQAAPEALIGILVIVLITVIGAFILQGALVRASVDDLSGKGVSIGSALSAGLQNVLPLIGLAVLYSLGVAAGMVLLIVPGIMLALRWCVGAPVLIVERKGVFDSMGRSAVLTKGHRWAIFGLLVIYVIVVGVINAAVQLTTIGDPAALAAGAMSAGVMLYFVIMPVLQAIESMISTVGIAVIYFELRRIKEGVGIAELAAVFE